MTLVFVGVGGILGALVRFQLGKIISQKATTSFPVGTFFINITGALLLGFITSIGAKDTVYLFLGDGFLGAYTTFSTFMYEGFNLFQMHKKLNAFVYILGSAILGIAGYLLGVKIGELISIL